MLCDLTVRHPLQTASSSLRNQTGAVLLSFIDLLCEKHELRGCQWRVECVGAYAICRGPADPIRFLGLQLDDCA